MAYFSKSDESVEIYFISPARKKPFTEALVEEPKEAGSREGKRSPLKGEEELVEETEGGVYRTMGLGDSVQRGYKEGRLLD